MNFHGNILSTNLKHCCLLAHEFSLEHSFNKLETLLSYKDETNLRHFARIALKKKLLPYKDDTNLQHFCQNCSEEIQSCYPMNFHWSILSTNLKHCCPSKKSLLCCQEKALFSGPKPTEATTTTFYYKSLQKFSGLCINLVYNL